MDRPVVRYLSRGRIISLTDFDPTLTLLDHLRLERGLCGTKEGCNEGDCGACTVVLARVRHGRVVHEPVNACILPVGLVDGAEVVTIEDLSADGFLAPIQRAMVEHHASQCGFCTPGIVMSLHALAQETEGPVPRQQIADQLAGNLCRCTGYRPIMTAAEQVLGGPRRDNPGRDRGRLDQIAALDDDSDVFIGTQDRFFAAPRTLASLLALYARHPDATLIGGGTDVGLWLTKALRDQPKLVALGRVRDLAAIRQTSKGIEIDAAVSLTDAASALAALAPDLGEIMRRFGSAQVRASGTVGGNIANGSPIGDLAPCLIALDARITLQSRDGARELPLEDFFVAYGRQDRRPGEIIRMLTIPVLADGQSFHAFKVSKRFDEDISTVLGAFRLAVRNGVLSDVRIACGGMAATPRRAFATERALIGLRLDDEAGYRSALAALEEDFQPLSDMRASAAYRLESARALLTKALMEAAGVPRSRTRLLDHVAVAS